jgi:hypothetical protein
MEGNMQTRYVKIMLLACSLILSGTLGATAMMTGELAPGSNNMLIASVSTEGTVCGAPIPVLFSAVPGDRQITITWSNEHTGNTSVTGYNIYYDRDEKSEPVTSVWPTTTYTLKGLINGQEYCLKVTSLHTGCESGFSNVICAVPAEQVPQK